jgi:TatD DNase family protein
MIDTHIHFYVDEYKNEQNELALKAKNAGITKMYLPAIDATHIANMVSTAQNFDGYCRLLAGLHPCSVKENNKLEFDAIEDMLQQHKIYGIGETGLDYYWDKTFAQQQIECLEIQIEIAIKLNLPLILHTRNAMQETIEIIKKYKNRNLRGIFHCFSGSAEQAKEIIKTGFYLGIGGVVTYKNAGLPEVLSNIDLKHIVLETDGPYLTPVPYRGKRNEPQYLLNVAEKIAEVKQISFEEVDLITTANAEELFGK